jgi:prepilin-type N-terminal cleavage/methylation domain-containing protein
MPRLRRVGFTLPEMLLALVLFGIVGVALYRVLVTNQRLYQAQTQRVDLNQNLRTAVDMLGAELRPLNASEGDIVAMAPDSIKIRAMRQLGFICQIPVLGGAQPLTGIWMVLRGSAPGDTLFFGTRNFSATRDSLLVYYEGGTVTRTDDTWLRAKLTAVAPATCPNGSAGQKLTFNLPPSWRRRPTSPGTSSSGLRSGASSTTWCTGPTRRATASGTWACATRTAFNRSSAPSRAVADSNSPTMTARGR